MACIIVVARDRLSNYWRREQEYVGRRHDKTPVRPGRFEGTSPRTRPSMMGAVRSACSAGPFTACPGSRPACAVVPAAIGDLPGSTPPRSSPLVFEFVQYRLQEF